MLSASGPTRLSLAGGEQPAWSPDGTRLAFVRDGEIGVLAVDSRTVRRLAEGAAPAWSPDGKRIAYTSGGDLWTMTATGAARRRVVPSTGDDVDPVWTRDGRHLLFATDLDGTYDIWIADLSTGVLLPVVRLPGDERNPALSPDGRTIAFSAAGSIYTAALDGSHVRRIAHGLQPAWAPDGSAIAFTTDRGIGLVRRDGSARRPLEASRRNDAQPTWGYAALARSLPLPDELLPDLDQRAPSGLAIVPSGGRYLLGFTSAVDNVGAGPLWIRGRRRAGTRFMDATQIVRLAAGSTRTYLGVGFLRFDDYPPHHHWHFQPFERYELRRASDFSLVVRDRKAGFCLADHYGLAAHRVRAFTGPRFLGSCGAGDRGATSVEEGESVGFTDRYPALFHGQDVDVTSVPAGLYVLVHRANPSGLLKELRYDNDAASVLLRLARRNGVPRVEMLARCDDSEDCSALLR